MAPLPSAACLALGKGSNLMKKRKILCRVPDRAADRATLGKDGAFAKCQIGWHSAKMAPLPSAADLALGKIFFFF
jgi:hypothetical protein